MKGKGERKENVQRGKWRKVGGREEGREVVRTGNGSKEKGA